MDLSCEFIVSGIVTGESGVFHVIGRCGDLPIAIGQMFDTLQDKSGQLRLVTLRVDGIQAYGRGFDQLGPGMTGTVDVSGNGIDFVGPGCVLIARSSSPAATHNQESQQAPQHA